MRASGNGGLIPPDAPRACPLPANINLINPGMPGLLGRGYTECVASPDQNSRSDYGEGSPPRASLRPDHNCSSDCSRPGLIHMH